MVRSRFVSSFDNELAQMDISWLKLGTPYDSGQGSVERKERPRTNLSVSYRTLNKVHFVLILIWLITALKTPMQNITTQWILEWLLGQLEIFLLENKFSFRILIDPMTIFSCPMVFVNLLGLTSTQVEDSQRTIIIRQKFWLHQNSGFPEFSLGKTFEAGDHWRATALTVRCEFSFSILITTEELVSIVNKKWCIPKSTLKRLVKTLGIKSEFEIFADGIKRSCKAVSIEDFLVSVYEYRPIFSTDIFG